MNFMKTKTAMKPVNGPTFHGRASALAAVVLAGALLGSLPALQGQVIYSGIQDIPIPADFDGVYLDLDTGTSSTTEIAGWEVNAFFGGYAIANSAAFQPVRLTTAVDSAVLNLAPGTPVGAGGTYATAEAGSEGHIGNAVGQFAGGSEGYLGFRFTPQGGGGPYYGWMRVVLTVDEPGGLIRDWAYDTTGGSLEVAAVPEPGSVAAATAMLLGLWVGIRRWRA